MDAVSRTNDDQAALTLLYHNIDDLASVWLEQHTYLTDKNQSKADIKSDIESSLPLDVKTTNKKWWESWFQQIMDRLVKTYKTQKAEISSKPTSQFEGGSKNESKRSEK